MRTPLKWLIGALLCSAALTPVLTSSARADEANSSDTPLTSEAMADYKCVITVDPSHGVNKPINILLQPAAVSGWIYGGTASMKKVGVIMDIEEVKDRSSMKMRAILDLFGSYQASGMNDRTKVTRVVVYKYNPPYKASTRVFRFFAGSKQIGGSYEAQEQAIRCLP